MARHLGWIWNAGVCACSLLAASSTGGANDSLAAPVIPAGVLWVPMGIPFGIRGYPMSARGRPVDANTLRLNTCDAHWISVGTHERTWVLMGIYE